MQEDSDDQTCLRTNPARYYKSKKSVLYKALRIYPLVEKQSGKTELLLKQVNGDICDMHHAQLRMKSSKIETKHKHITTVSFTNTSVKVFTAYAKLFRIISEDGIPRTITITVVDALFCIPHKNTASDMQRVMAMFL